MTELTDWLRSPALQEIRVQSLGREEPLEDVMAIHSSIFARKNRFPLTGNPVDREAWQAIFHGVANRRTQIEMIEHSRTHA